MFVLPTFGLGVIGSPTVPPETFDTATLENGQTAIGNLNTLTFTVNPSASISAGATLTIAGLTGSQTADSGSLTVGGAGAAIFGSSGSWTQSSGTLVLTVASGQSVPTGSDTVITFTLTNPATTSSGVTGITLASDGFTTANISGTFLNAVALFNVTTRDTEANILASTPTNPSGEVNIAFGTDTNDFYIYDGSAWYIYKDEYTNLLSVNFDGSDDYIDLGTSSSLNPSSALTISAWIYINGAGTGSLPTIYSSSKDSAGSSGGIAIAYVSNKIRFYLDTSGGSGWVFAESNSTVSTGQWYHLVGIWDGSTVTLYVDGTAQTTTASASTIGYKTGFPATIGRYTSNYFNGLIDEVALFDSALSSTDRAALRDTSGSNPIPADITSLSPLGWWRMGDNDGGTGTTITDQGSGGNNGTLTNGPTFSTTVPS